MTDEELIALIDRNLTRCNELQVDQASLLNDYHGEPYGNEKDGRSQVVMRDVLETVEWIKPSLLRIFASGDRFGQFEPMDRDDEERSEQETEVTLRRLEKDNDWFEFVYSWITTPLIEKISYAKIYADKETKSRVETYYAQTAEQVEAILEAGEPLSYSQEVVAMPYGEMVLHDIKVRVDEDGYKIRVECVPNEEIKLDPDWNKLSVDDLPFISHERKIPASDLVEMGVDRDIVNQLIEEASEETLDRARSKYKDSIETELDKSMRPITVSESYLKVDMNGDGIAEYRRVLKSGKHILENDEWDYCPFVAMSAKPLPSTHVGLAEADLVSDIQKVRTVIVRQIIDNLNLTNNPERIGDPNRCEVEDFKQSIPGDFKRGEVDAVRDLTVPFTAGASLPFLDILDNMKAARTGIDRNTMGVDADVLAQSTKGAYMGALKQANQQIEMLARIFAETGFKKLLLKAHHLIRKYQDVPFEMKVAQKWQVVDPREWAERDDVVVTVGTGSANDDEMVQKLWVLGEKLGELILAGSSIADEQKLYNVMTDIIRKSGLKDETRYINDPSQQPPKQPQGPSAEEQLIASEREKTAQKAQKDQADVVIKLRDQDRKDREQALKEAEFEHAAAVDISDAGLRWEQQKTTAYEPVV